MRKISKCDVTYDDNGVYIMPEFQAGMIVRPDENGILSIFEPIRDIPIESLVPYIPEQPFIEATTVMAEAKTNKLKKSWTYLTTYTGIA